MAITLLSTNTWQIPHVSGETFKVGPNKTTFSPEFFLSAFKGLGGLRIVPQVTGRYTPSIIGDVLTASTSGMSFQFKSTPVIPGVNQWGGIDLITVLSKKPSSNRISFGYDPTILTPLFQGALTIDQITRGVERPENVVNSIAWYHPSKGGMASPDDVDHRILTGKAWHQYRMLATDKNGGKSWTNWELLSGNQFDLVIDQAFLNAAVYPITIAPLADTFGNTVLGASEDSFSTDRIFVRVGNPGQAGTATDIRWGARTLDIAFAWQGALYDAAKAKLTPQTATGTVTNTGAMGWNILNFTGGPAVSNANFYICAFADSITDARYALDTGGSDPYENATYNTWPATGTFTSTYNEVHSIYCTYTPGAGAARARAAYYHHYNSMRNS